MSGDPISALMADLTYLTYAHNRDTSPDITPQSWRKVFGPEADDFEARYQAEKLIAKARDQNAYAEAMIRKDQRERNEGRPEHDRDFVGRILRAGH